MAMQKYEQAGVQIVEGVKHLLDEGNARKISITRGEEKVAEFPLTFGVIGAVIAPAVAAIAGIAALATDCTVKVERVAEPPAA
jgi:Domain of unknown function (DUF4342)